MGLISSRWPGLVVNEDRVIADEGGLLDAYASDVYGIRQLEGIEYAIDIGAHVGGATALLHERFPDAKLIAVECCPDNILALHANVGHFAHVAQAACTYEPGPLVLASTVRDGCRTSGSSVVTSRARWDAGHVAFTWDPNDYQLDERPLEIVTLEQLMETYGFPRVDLLKLDCEGSEFSILPRCAGLDIRVIVGEYHDEPRFLGAFPDGFALEQFHGGLFTLEKMEASRPVKGSA